MRVILVSQYFPPETGGPANRAVSLARGLRDEGHDVCVIAEKPSHPEGKIWPDYRVGLTLQRTWEGIPVTYVWVHARPGKGLWSRLANHISFLIVAVFASLRCKGRIDAVLSTSPPLFVGVAGWMIARLRRACHVLDVRDLWPDIAVALGQLRNPLWIRLSKRLERALYRSADAVTAVTESFCDTITSHVREPSKVHLIRNGTQPEFFGHRDAPSITRLRAGLGAHENHFVLAYVGNLGIAQGLDHIVGAARVLERSNDRVHIVMVGAGPTKNHLQERAARASLTNLSFLPRVDQERAADWMAAADALLVSLADVDMLCQFVPSKLYDAFAAGRPVVLGARGEARVILEASGGGLAYRPEDADALVRAVRLLCADAQLCQRLGRSGAAYGREHCDRATHARNMVRLLEKAILCKAVPQSRQDPDRVLPRSTG